VAVAASCMPTVQPKYLAYKIATGYFLDDAEYSPFFANETLINKCFSLVTAAPATVYPLHDVPLGHIPYVMVTYSATAFAVTPATDPLQVITTVSGTFTITSAEVLTTSNVLSLVSVADSLIFTTATLSGDCALSGTRTATQISFKSTKAITQGVSTVLTCTVTGMTVAFGNAASRVVASDPYILLANTVVLRTPSNPTVGAALAANIVLRVAATPKYYWHMTSPNRYIISGPSESTSRSLWAGLNVYLYATTPAAGSAAYSIVLNSTACPGLTLISGVGTIPLDSSSTYRVTTITTVSVYFDVTNTAYYPLSPATCFTVTSSSGSVTQAGTSTIALSGYSSRPLDFAIYPVAAQLASSVNVMDPSVDTAPVDVDWEVVIWPHTAQAATFTLNLLAQPTIAPRLVFSSGIVRKTSASTQFTEIACTPVVVNTTLLQLANCPAIASAGNYRFVTRVIRFGPVRTTYADYRKIFDSYYGTGMIGYITAGATF